MPLDMRQQDLPLGLSPKPCFEDIADRSIRPGIPLPELGKLYAAELQARCLQPPSYQSLLYSHDKDGKRFSRSDLRSWCAAAVITAPHGALESSQKNLLIFDQSRNQTRLLHYPFPLRFPSPTTAGEPVKLSHELEKCLGEDRVTSKEFDDNHLSGKESEMHEDTEEINALLYSDDEYDDDDDDCESDDEVMSTGHSPYSPEHVCNKRDREEIDGPCKRQKLDTESSQLDGSFFLKEDNLPESNISTKEDASSGLSNEQSKKDKIRTALKILESIVPGAKGNKALSLLDEAIDYLKLLKQDLISSEAKIKTSTSQEEPVVKDTTTWGTRNLQTDQV